MFLSKVEIPNQWLTFQMVLKFKAVSSDSWLLVVGDLIAHLNLNIMH